MRNSIRGLIVLLVFPHTGLSFAGLQEQGPQTLEERQSKKERRAPHRIREKAPYEQFAAYWTAEGGWRTEIHLKNNTETHELKVTPVLRFANGEEVQLREVSVRPSDVLTLDLEEFAGEALYRRQERFGSLLFRYSAYGFRNIYVTVMVHNHGYPISFHLDGTNLAPRIGKGSREGVWWVPAPSSKAAVILANQSGAAIPLALTMRGLKATSARTENLTIGPRQTLRIDLVQLRKRFGISDEWGSFTIDAHANAGALDSFAYVYDEPAGFSSFLKMFTKDPASRRKERDFNREDTWVTRAPMLALSAPDPALGFPLDTRLNPLIVLSNASNNLAEYTVRLDWRDGEAAKSHTFPATLPARETRVIDVGALQSKSLVSPGAHWATATLECKACLPDDPSA